MQDHELSIALVRVLEDQTLHYVTEQGEQVTEVIERVFWTGTDKLLLQIANGQMFDVQIAERHSIRV